MLSAIAIMAKEPKKVNMKKAAKGAIKPFHIYVTIYFCEGNRERFSIAVCTGTRRTVITADQKGNYPGEYRICRVASCVPRGRRT